MEQFPAVPSVAGRIFSDVGDCVSCTGSTGLQDLALHLVARHSGPERAQQNLRHMVMNNKREANFPQAQFTVEAKILQDSVVRRSVSLMEQTLNAPISLDHLAARLDISSRQLSRRSQNRLGETPPRYYRSLRVRYGAWRLVHSTDPVVAIAADAGFVDASHFQREFQQVYGAAPANYRRSLNEHGRVPAGVEINGPSATT